MLHFSKHLTCKPHIESETAYTNLTSVHSFQSPLTWCHKDGYLHGTRAFILTCQLVLEPFPKHPQSSLGLSLVASVCSPSVTVNWGHTAVAYEVFCPFIISCNRSFLSSFYKCWVFSPNFSTPSQSNKNRSWY